jgi:Fe2+ or Zn2+ uptake regulation protein
MYTENDRLIINKLKEHQVLVTQNRIAVFKLLAGSKTSLSVCILVGEAI